MGTKSFNNFRHRSCFNRRGFHNYLALFGIKNNIFLGSDFLNHSWSRPIPILKRNKKWSIFHRPKIAVLRDPGCLSWILIFVHPGSKNSNKREGWKKICCPTFFSSHKNHKIVNVPRRLCFAAQQRIAITWSPNFYKKMQRFTTRKNQKENRPDVK